MEEKEIESLINKFDNSAKDVSTVSNCLLQTSNANNWKDIVFESTNSFIYDCDSEFRKEIAFLDLDKLIIRGKELLSMELYETQVLANEAIKQAETAISFNEGIIL